MSNKVSLKGKLVRGLTLMYFIVFLHDEPLPLLPLGLHAAPGPGRQALPVLVRDWPGVQVGDVGTAVQEVPPVVHGLPQDGVSYQVQDVQGHHHGQDGDDLGLLQVVVRQI